jgi:hypothetical protein
MWWWKGYGSEARQLQNVIEVAISSPWPPASTVTQYGDNVRAAPQTVGGGGGRAGDAMKLI